MTQSKTKTPANKIDEKQKKHYIELVLKEHPELGKDALQLHYIEQMVESYLHDPDEFNRKTTEIIKKEKKKPPQEPQKLPDEIVCISKIEAKEEEGIKDVNISQDSREDAEDTSTIHSV
jgi:hypothetical protein